jgi:GTP cyclohydrolase I
MKDALRQFLEDLQEEPDREGLKKTPERFIEAFEFLTSGYGHSPEELAQEALFEADTQDFVLLKDIEFFSLCEHHLLPFFGKAHIGYFPGKTMIGLSKIPGIVDLFARRLQTQERLGEQILRSLEVILKPRGVGVVLEARHFCMMMRGTGKTQTTVVTHHRSGIVGKDAPFPI